MPAAYGRALRALRGLSPLERRLTYAALALGALLRLVVIPTRLVMIFMGYRMAAEVYAFTSVPKYGAGSLVLYRIAYALFGTGHDTIVWVNVVCGVLSVPLLVALFARLKPPAWSVAVAAALLSFVPVFLHDHRTESILVPTTLFLWAALLLVDSWLEDQRDLNLLGAVVFLALALISRPEMALVAPLSIVALLWTRGFSTLRGRVSMLVAGVVALAILTAPHLLHMKLVVQEQMARGALPALTQAPEASNSSWGRKIADLFVSKNILYLPYLFPPAITVFALLSLAVARAHMRRFVFAGWVLLYAWATCYQMDLPWTSIPRLLAPVAAIASLLGAVAIGWLLSIDRLGPVPLGPKLARIGLVFGVIAITAIPSGKRLWAVTNEDEEERFIKSALAKLPDEQVCFVRIDDTDDPEPRKTHRYFPDYLVRPPRRDDRVFGIRRWAQDKPTEDECPGGTYFFQNLRCYAAYIDFPKEHKEPREPMLSACQWIRGQSQMQPVLTERLPNHGDNEFGYYPEVPELEVGLFRVSGEPAQAGAE